MKILVCYDASPISKIALEKSITMATNLKAEVHIFTSIPPIKEPSEVFEFIESENEREVKKRKEYMAKAEKKVKMKGIPCHIHISNRGKKAGNDIVDFANEIDADYLAIWVRRRSKLEKIVFGSNVQHVVMNSPCPVVTVNE